MTGSIVVAPQDYETPLNVMGDSITPLLRAGTEGSYAITLVKGREGNGPPPHRHDWDESFFVITGTVDFASEGRSRTAVPGTLVHFPAGTVHSFTYGPGGSEVLEITGRGTKAIAMFAALDREIARGTQDFARTVEVLAEHGVTVVP